MLEPLLYTPNPQASLSPEPKLDKLAAVALLKALGVSRLRLQVLVLCLPSNDQHRVAGTRMVFTLMLRVF